MKKNTVFIWKVGVELKEKLEPKIDAHISIINIYLLGHTLLNVRIITSMYYYVLIFKLQKNLLLFFYKID